MDNLFMALAFLAFVFQINAAVNFSLSPNTISNTYVGPVTLQVTGLTNTETVVVQKFLDANTNGMVDAADLLVQQFTLTDGQAGLVIGGVTNLNVPGDTDGAANGTITAKWNFPDPNFMQNIVGQFIYRVSSPVGHFSAVTATFNVTNFPFAQRITGTVVSDSTAVGNAVIVLFPPPQPGQDLGNPLGGVVANNSGVYSVQVPGGTYVPLALKTNYVTDYSKSPVITVGNSQSVNTNLTVTNATASISGRVVDANNSSIGLPGIFLPATMSGVGDVLLAPGFTDTNGNFILRVGSGTWGISGDAAGALTILGYVGYDSSTSVNAGAMGVNLAIQKATAMFYGTVKDSSGNPLPGVAIESYDDNGLYSSEGISDTNGNYAVTAIGGLDNYQWTVQKDHKNNSGPPNFLYSPGTNNVTLGSGQALNYNFTGVLATNYINGHVQFNHTNVVGVQVYALAVIGDNFYQSQADTDVSGNYSFIVANGDWMVNVYDCGCADISNSLSVVLSSQNYQDPSGQGVTVSNNNQTANFTVQPPGGGLGGIHGYVMDTNFIPIANISVYASDGLGDNYTTNTDGNGYYEMDNVENGAYDVSLDCKQLNSAGYSCLTDDFVNVSFELADADFTVTPTFTTVYGFSAGGVNVQSLTTNSDGASPYGGLLLVSNLLYGATQYGGTNGEGSIFAVNTNLNSPTFALVHAFAAPEINSLGTYTNSEGGVPEDALIACSNILYGTASQGGLNGNGTVFAINAGGSGYRVIHTFTALDAANQATNTDGANPNSGLVLFSTFLYGTATFGGTNGSGVVFAVDTNGSFSLVHTFSGLDPVAGTNTDGANPYGTLILSGATLYGTAASGGTSGFGTVFKVNTDGTGFATLYSFSGGDDGDTPLAGLVQFGNMLYGTTVYGGTSDNGTVFAINTDGTGFTVLHPFSGLDDGGYPNALILSGNTLYGTTEFGTNGNGTLFAIATAGTNFLVLHGFTGGTDGADPSGNLVLVGNTLYGTTGRGGTGGDGTVFAVSITPSAPAPTISDAHFANGQFQMTVNGTAGQNYSIQVSTNLISTNWTSLWTTNPIGGTFLFSDPNATNKQRYYRIWVGP